MSESDRIRLLHMLDAAKEALAFDSGRERTHLESNRMLALALIKEVEIIGEAATRVSRELADANPQIPWAKVAGMRNRLIHAYFDIDFDILWETVVTAVPALATETTGIIRVIYLRPSPAPERFNKKASQTLTN